MDRFPISHTEKTTCRLVKSVLVKWEKLIWCFGVESVQTLSFLIFSSFLLLLCLICEIFLASFEAWKVKAWMFQWVPLPGVRHSVITPTRCRKAAEKLQDGDFCCRQDGETTREWESEKIHIVSKLRSLRWFFHFTSDSRSLLRSNTPLRAPPVCFAWMWKCEIVWGSKNRETSEPTENISTYNSSGFSPFTRWHIESLIAGLTSLFHRRTEERRRLNPGAARPGSKPAYAKMQIYTNQSLRDTCQMLSNTGQQLSDSCQLFSDTSHLLRDTYQL